VPESALEGELTDHLGDSSSTTRPAGAAATRATGVGAKTVLTDIGPVDIDVPRDRDGSFAPQIVAKRQRRLSGVEDLVLSLSAKGRTHGGDQPHLAEVYGASVSKTTISTITEKVLAGMAE
jgi:putative transposase